MTLKIFFGQNSVRESFKKMLLYYSKKNGARKAWKKRHSIVIRSHPDYRKPVDSLTEKEHRDAWSGFIGKVPVMTFRICGNISGTSDPAIVPEEVFQADIEPTLNRYGEGHIFANKSLYDHWFSCNTFPKTVLHSLDGELMDYDLNHLTASQASELISHFEFPLLFKPNVNTSGGDGIRLLEHVDDLEVKMRTEQNFVVQNMLEQHPKLAIYNPESINTVRVYLYKSVADNRVHILNIAQRMGNGTILDNVSAGGLVSYVNPDGTLHGYALDKYGGKFHSHPLTGVTFDQTLPDFEQLKKLSLSIAQKLFRIRVVGLDMFYDHTGRWRALEINTRGHSIRFSQYAGHPFFGEFTEEVIEYCKENHWALTD